MRRSSPSDGAHKNSRREEEEFLSFNYRIKLVEVGGFACKEPSLSREFAQRCQVLSEFHGTKVLAFVVANCEVTDMDELVLKVDPELSDVLTPRAKVVQDFVNRIGAPGRVAMLNLSSDDCFTACKNTIQAFAEEGNAVLSIDECQIKRQS